MANQMATEKLANVVYLDRPAAGWFVLDVMRREHGKWDWAALMVDFDPTIQIAWARQQTHTTPGFVSRASTGTGMPL